MAAKMMYNIREVKGENNMEYDKLNEIDLRGAIYIFLYSRAPLYKNGNEVICVSQGNRMDSVRALKKLLNDEYFKHPLNKDVVITVVYSYHNYEPL